jgi:sugar/nucleoside kinase (ribokinase family)
MMPHTREWKIVSLGDLVADLNLEIQAFPIVPEIHQLVKTIGFEPGGAGNFLIAGRHLGARMLALGVVGNDPYGSELISVFEAEGIDTRGIIQQPNGSTTLVLVLADGQGKHVFLGHVGEGPEVPIQEYWKSAIKSADAVHTYGYTLQETRLVNAFLDGMAFARTCKKPVYFDPGPYIQNASWDLRERALTYCTAVLLTEDEIPLVMRHGKSAQDAAKLLSEDINLVVVKRGHAGCIAFTHDGEIDHPGFPVSQVDSTGAGDSFAAALILAVLQGYPLPKVLAIANAMGAAKVRKLGSGRQVPTLDEIRDVLGEDIQF